MEWLLCSGHCSSCLRDSSNLPSWRLHSNGKMNNKQCIKYIFYLWKTLHRVEARKLRVGDAILDRMLGKYRWKDGICKKELKGNERANHEVFLGRRSFLGRGNCKCEDHVGGETGFDLLEGQQTDQRVWNGVSKVVCNTRSQMGEVGLGSSGSTGTGHIGHWGEQLFKILYSEWYGKLLGGFKQRSSMI